APELCLHKISRVSGIMDRFIIGIYLFMVFQSRLWPPMLVLPRGRLASRQRGGSGDRIDDALPLERQPARILTYLMHCANLMHCAKNRPTTTPFAPPACRGGVTGEAKAWQVGRPRRCGHDVAGGTRNFKQPIGPHLCGPSAADDRISCR